MRIFDPNSESFNFYHKVFTNISINQLLHGSGVCRLIKDMTTEEYAIYMKYLGSNVKDVQK